MAKRVSKTASDGSTLAVTDDVRRGVDGSSLAAEIGLDREEIAWRKTFTGFDDSTASELESMSGLFEDVADELVEEFYDHLTDHQRTVDIFDRSSKGIEQLKQTQQEYLLDLGTGDYDRAYFGKRARIGKIHDLLDLGPRVYLGAYSTYYEGLMDAIAEEAVDSVVETYGDSGADGAVEQAVTEAVDRVSDRMMAVCKILNLDQQVAMDTYIDSYNKQAEAEAQRRKEVSHEVETEVKEPIQELDSAADQAASETRRIDQLTTDQTRNMETISTEVANLSATIEQLAATADEVESTSDTAETLAETGQDSADEAIDVMETVQNSAQTVADDLDQLQDRVDEIDDIVEVIDDIAEQTNILALNASIEAARAGQEGEGFAVVANEVKSLAEQSREQAREIEEMVDQIPIFRTPNEQPANMRKPS
ncbi:MAG: protoglobin domain-containing protein [Halorientalis sp.]